MDMVEFIAFMSLGGLAPTMIITYISGVKHHLCLKGARDFNDSLLLGLTPKVVAASLHEPDVRLPITLPVLERMLHAPLIHDNQFEVCMYSALLRVGFYGIF